MEGLRQLRGAVIAFTLLVLPAFGDEPELTVPYRSYSLPLSSYAPVGGRLQGLYLRLSINGGPSLRLLLDTGSTDLVLTGKAARRSGIKTDSALTMVCAGKDAAKEMRTGVADSIAVGPLEFRNYPVDVAPGQLGEGLDGVAPVSLFRGFLIRLDLTHKFLELSPYPRAPISEGNGFVRAAIAANLLFIPTEMNQAREGQVLIDTGASYTAVSRPVARALQSQLVSPVRIMAGDGALTGHYLQPPVRFQVAGRPIEPEQTVAIDLSAMSRYSELDVAGVLGFPDLRYKVLTIDYRDAVVKIEPGR